MKKGLVKIVAAAMIAATITGTFTLSAFAVPTVKDEGGWVLTNSMAASTKKTIKVINVLDQSEGLTVTAYQIVKGTYKDDKLTGYVACDSIVDIGDFSKPSAEKITDIANDIDSSGLQGIKMTAGKDSKGNLTGEYTAEVEAGLYIVLVTGSDSIVYNPAIVAVNIQNANDLSTAYSDKDGVDMTKYFNVDSEAYLKASDSGFDKKILGSSKADSNTKTTDAKIENGDTIAIGDKVYFQLDSMTIPSYSADYVSDVIYKITDNLEATAFEGVSVQNVYVGGIADENKVPAVTEVEGGKSVENYTLTYYKSVESKLVETENESEATSFTIEFTDKFIRANGNKSVQVNYYSTVSETAGINYAENQNTATLEYSNNPKNSADVKKLTDTTYHYTFGIDASIDAEDPDNKETTHELNKVTEKSKNGESDFVDVKGDDEKLLTRKSTKPLEGATFTLYSDSGYTNAIGTATSNDDGHFSFTGLDEGTYFLKETAAPTSPVKYTLNPINYRIVISAELNEKGVMTEYSITTYNDDEYVKAGNNEEKKLESRVGSATYTNTPAIDKNDGSVTNNIASNISPVEIVNTPLAALPSTGGAGTIALTLGASLGMGAFLTIHLINKKKSKVTE